MDCDQFHERKEEDGIENNGGGRCFMEMGSGRILQRIFKLRPEDGQEPTMGKHSRQREFFQCRAFIQER